MADKRIPLMDAHGRPIAFELHKPIRSFGEDLSHLTFYAEPLTDDMIAADEGSKSEVGALKILICRCTGITEKEAGAIHARDMRRAAQILHSFLGEGGKTTEQVLTALGSPAPKNEGAAGG